MPAAMNDPDLLREKVACSFFLVNLLHCLDDMTSAGRLSPHHVVVPDEKNGSPVSAFGTILLGVKGDYYNPISLARWMASRRVPAPSFR